MALIDISGFFSNILPSYFLDLKPKHLLLTPLTSQFSRFDFKSFKKAFTQDFGHAIPGSRMLFPHFSLAQLSLLTALLLRYFL